jgi:hypothetical protein
VVAGGLTVLPARDGSWLNQLGIVATYALLAGILGTLATGWLVGGYGDRLWLVMGLVALLSLAVSIVVAAGARIMGVAGVALGALVLVLLGLVSSGGPLGTEFLPDAYRAIAPWLPVGPSFSALRGVLYFDGAGAGEPVILLVGWATVGIVAIAAHGLGRQAQRQVAPAGA